ncbi:MAG: DUF1552 domain-containing protein [Planctomycetaceae bacterium]|nr:DUF1552 domain-containing protein [Planctomycetaceae bacterium]
MNAFSLRQRVLSRRTMLRGAGVALGLPVLDAMRLACAARPEPAPPRRMIALCTNMGILPHFFFPKTAGEHYESTPYLELLKDHRSDLTVFSGVSLPDVDGGHSAENCFLTAAPHPTRGGFKNTISLDQFAADKLGQQTRFPTLNLHAGVESNMRMGASLSWTAGGVIIPGERKPTRVFAKLFLSGAADEVEQQVAKIRRGRSILDTVGERAKALEKTLGPTDREKLDQYFTGVRELEERLRIAEAWEYKPKPQVTIAPPKDIEDPAELLKQTQLMNQLAKLAIETDSTRIVTIFLYQGAGKQNFPGVTLATHGLTHQAGSENRRQELRLLEAAQFRVFNELLASLKGTQDGDGTLLDHTLVLYGTNFGNAGLHTNTNLPVVLAGGPFRHGRHLAFDTQHNYPLTNLYVSMLQALGVETDRFASGTTTMRGLEMKRV